MEVADVEFKGQGRPQEARMAHALRGRVDC